VRAPTETQPGRGAACPGFITDLVLRCAGGEADALGRLLDLFYAPVTRHLAGLVPEGQVDDVVAEVFARVWREAPDFRPGAQGGAVGWVLGLAEGVATTSGRTPVGC
jgi:hypothetical protein